MAIPKNFALFKIKFAAISLHQLPPNKSNDLFFWWENFLFLVAICQNQFCTFRCFFLISLYNCRYPDA